MKKPVTQLLLLALTLTCGAVWLGLGLLPTFVPQAAENPYIPTFMTTLSGLFASGMTTLFILWGK